jgi:hypothetical protein
MVTTLSMKCPHCEQVSQLFLSTTVSVIILHCPSCRSPIMYFRRKIFLLDPRRVKKITGSSHAILVSRLIEQIAAAEAAVQGPEKNALHPEQNPACDAVPHKLTLDQPGRKYITGDDCTNLRIELELCADAKSFIDRL